MGYSMSLNMGPKQGQSLKQTQRLIMSPQMQQAIHLLQMPIMELSTMVDAEMEHNPILEYADETNVDDDRVREAEEEVYEENRDADFEVEREVTFDDKDFEIMKRLDEEFRDHFDQNAGFNTRRSAQEEKLKAFMESSIKSQITLFEYLMNQARETFETEVELDMAEAIIGNLDERGFLEMELEEMSLLYELDLDQLITVLEEIQAFEPHGVGARNVRESLLIQLNFQGKKGSVAYQIIDQCYDDLLYNRIPLIKKLLGYSADEIHDAVQSEIAKLDLYPGTWFSNEVSQFITPDISIIEDGEGLKVEVEDSILPSLKLNSKYMQMLNDDSLPEETREFIRQKVASGKWFMRNIHQRNETLTRIVDYLLKYQSAFFRSSEGKLQPLTMKTVADSLEVHESTVARAVSNKYLDCPRGLLALRSFFTNSYTTVEGDISSQTVKDLLLELLDGENKRKPLSDEKLSVMIKAKGIPCARRTVAKYRGELNIGNASQRRKFA